MSAEHAQPAKDSMDSMGISPSRRAAVNLRRSVVDEFWKQRDPRLARILGFMESVESWMVDDHEQVAGALGLLTRKLASANPNSVVQQADAMLDIMAYMSSPRAIRLLEWMDGHFQNEIALQMVERAIERPDDPRAQILLDRLQAMRSLALLGRIFCPTRTRLVAEALRVHQAAQDG